MENNNNASSLKLVAGAIIVVGVIIAGAILLKGKSPAPAPQPVTNNGGGTTVTALDPITSSDFTLGNQNASVAVVLYTDFQCPFCGDFFKKVEQPVINNYIKQNKIEFVYRDFAFLGQESIEAAQAARCANDQGKFWEYHDYLFTHQNGEGQGAFSNPNLKSFAKILGLDTTTFNQCLESRKYAQAVTDATAAGTKAGVQGTPKGFILKNGKVVDTIDGDLPATSITQKIEAALK